MDAGLTRVKNRTSPLEQAFIVLNPDSAVGDEGKGEAQALKHYDSVPSLLHAHASLSIVATLIAEPGLSGTSRKKRRVLLESIEIVSTG
jgi:hypothetical protein